MGHRAPRVLVVAVATVVAMVASGCGAVTSKPRTAGPLPRELVALGPANSAAAAEGSSAGYCAGVLIAPKKVLTAARCLRKRKARAVQARVLDEEGCLVRTRRRGVGARRASLGAATVLRLQGKVPAGTDPLPVGDVPAEGEVVEAWGWGPGQPGDACVPRPSRLTVLAEDACSDLVGDDRVTVYFCAVPEAESDNTCPGDLGGPVLDEEGRLVGITVTGKECGSDRPARYWSTANLVPREG